MTQNGNKVNLRKEGIAWKSDVSDKFKDRKLGSRETNYYGSMRLPEVNDEDFIVWMRTAGLPTFKKLYRIIDQDLQQGDKIVFFVHNVYPVSGFSGEKAIILSTTSWLGGKNDFLGIAYLVVGALCVVLALVFLLKHKLSPRPLGDMRYFNWGASSRPAAAS